MAATLQLLFLSLSTWILASATSVPVHTTGKFSPAFGPPFHLKLGNGTAEICNSSTPGTSGFIETQHGAGKSSMFFWLFESKNDPSIDPVILWMSGGPGASSAGMGNLMEVGPCRISPDGNATVDNPYGWNANATLLFVDQPAGVGFSTGPIPDGLVHASQLMDGFLRNFFVAFPSLAGRDFYIAGESYGGSWVPALAVTILKSQQAESSEPSRSRLTVQHSDGQYGHDSDGQLGTSRPFIHLRGIMIGNGLVRQAIQNVGAFQTACSGPESPLNATECAEWAPRAMWCERNLGVCEREGFLSSSCKEAQDRCSALANLIINEKGLNPYDWSRTCDNPPFCYSEIPQIEKYLNQSFVKEALGVKLDAAFRGISYEVFEKWEKNGDLWRSSDKYVNHLLENDVDVLIYVGDKDWYCNAAGMRRLVDEGLTWHGHPLFRIRELLPWYHQVKRAGRWKSFAQLTYAEIEGSGHLAPFDEPAKTLTLINSWLLKRQLPAQ